MARMKNFLGSFDTKELARKGDPARYRRRVGEFLALYDRLMAGEAFTEDFARLWLPALAQLELALPWRKREKLATGMIVSMKAELPCYALVAVHFAWDMDRLYNHEDRTRENFWFLRASARLELARLRMEKGWVLPGLHAEWRLAKQMFKFAGEKLQALWDDAHPQPKVIVRHHHHTQTITQSIPSYHQGGF